MTATATNWGSIADWVSGLGSLCAVVTALYLSRAANRVRLHGLCGHRLVVGGGRDTQELISLSVTNIGTRATVIKSIGMRFGLFRRRYAYLNLQRNEHMDAMPRPLADGEQAHWGIPLDKDRLWILDLFEKQLVQSGVDVKTMVIQVHTTNGGIFTFRPEPALRKMISTAWSQRCDGG